MSLRACFSLLIFVCFFSCRKKIELPPDNRHLDPGLKVSASIKELKEWPLYTPVLEDFIVSGIVVMNDAEGNYFKKIAIQDSTGGIEILLDQNYLYRDFPLGRKVYVRCKGLYLGTNALHPQLGYLPDPAGQLSSIPELFISEHVVKASYPHHVLPDTISLPALLDPEGATERLNTIVVIPDVEFETGPDRVPFAEPAAMQSFTDRLLIDCTGAGVPIRTSARASFRSEILPSGSGYITALYTRNYNRPLLIVRSPNDVQFDQLRCDERHTILLKEDFAAQAEGQPVQLGGWKHWAEAGGRYFIAGMENGRSYARITAFGGPVPPYVKTWLITPEIVIGEKLFPRLLFSTRDGYDNGAKFKVYISSGYQDNTDPNSAVWEPLSTSVSAGSTAGYATEWTNSYTVLKPRTRVHIAFCYEGGAGKTTTFDLSSIKVITE
jgi:hypothetical protein